MVTIALFFTETAVEEEEVVVEAEVVEVVKIIKV